MWNRCSLLKTDLAVRPLLARCAGRYNNFGMQFQRSSGILLHISSLPSYGGIGDLGPAAHEFVAFLAAAKQHVWQVLPLCPTGYGNSPYAGSSAFAGNPFLISLEFLVDWGWIASDRIAGLAGRERHTWTSTKLRRRRCRCCMRRRGIFSIADRTIRSWPGSGSGFEQFCRAEESWLERLRSLCRVAPPVWHRSMDGMAGADAPPRAAGAGASGRKKRPRIGAGAGAAVCVCGAMEQSARGRGTECDPHSGRRGDLRQHGFSGRVGASGHL